MSHFITSRLVAFLFMLAIYFLTIGLYYNHTHALIIEETERNIENTLLAQRALANLVSDVQKNEINRLQKLGILDKDYFSAALLSSSYITKEHNRYTNIEREKLGLKPYQFKYISTNPTNPQNRADVYELAVFEKLKFGKEQVFKDIVTEDGHKYLYFAIAGRHMEKKCLNCHGNPADAPKSLLQIYGSENGFGFKEGDLSSIISIKAPLDHIYKNNDKRFFIIAAVILLLFIFLFILAETINAHLKTKDNELKTVQAIQEKEQAKSKALESSLDNLYEHVISLKFDAKGLVTEVSDALCRLSGYTREELIGEKLFSFRHPDMTEAFFTAVWKKLVSGETWTGEVKNLTKNDEVFWVEAVITPLRDSKEHVSGFESIMHVITEKKVLLETVNTDPLTNLLSRRSFEECFNNERERARRDEKFFALIIIDIDFFKDYNDNYGHLQGDAALVTVSEGITKSFQRANDFIFRIGGEEFAVITSAKTKEDLMQTAHRAIEQIRAQKIEHANSQVSQYMTISMGMAIVSKDSNASLREIYEQSDFALYHAKQNGRDQLQFVEL